MTNADLEQLVATSDEWIRERRGFVSAALRLEGQACSDLGLIAAERALKAAGLSGSDLDLILLATCRGYAVRLPVCSNIAGRNARQLATCLRPAAGSLCAGGCRCVCSDGMRHVLVVGSEVMSTITDWTDRNTRILFGDGAGAVVSASEGDRILSPFAFRRSLSDRSWCRGWDRIPRRSDDERAVVQYIKMKGNETSRWRTLEDVARRPRAHHLGGRSGRIFPHQANLHYQRRWPIAPAATRKSGLEYGSVRQHVCRLHPIALDNEAVRSVTGGSRMASW